MNRFTYGAMPVIAAAALTLALIPTAVQAHEKPSNITAVWWAQGANQWPVEGQTLAASKPSEVLDLAFIESEANKLGCGFTIQGDLYADDAITAALLAGGKLFAPENPDESWPGGHYKAEFSTVFYTGDCPPPVEPPVYPGDILTTLETVPAIDCELNLVSWTVIQYKQVGTLVDNVWVFSEPVETGRETFTRETTDIECPPVVVPPVDPPVEPPVVVDPPVVIDPPIIDPPVTVDPPTVTDPPVSTPPALVTTGVETDALGWSAALLTAGLAFVLWARNRNRIANLKHRA